MKKYTKKIQRTKRRTKRRIKRRIKRTRKYNRKGGGMMDRQMHALLGSLARNHTIRGKNKRKQNKITSDSLEDKLSDTYSTIKLYLQRVSKIIKSRKGHASTEKCIDAIIRPLELLLSLIKKTMGEFEKRSDPRAIKGMIDNCVEDGHDDKQATLIEEKYDDIVEYIDKYLGGHKQYKGLKRKFDEFSNLL
jgi:hypothetical protein